MEKTKSLAALQKAFKTSLPIQSSFRRDYTIIDIGNGDNNIVYSLNDYGFFANFQSSKKGEKPIRDHLNEILCALEDFAFGLGAKYIQLFFRNDRFIIPGNNDQQLLTFETIAHHEQLQNLLPNFHQFPFVKFFNPDWKTDKLKILTVLQHLLQQKKQKEPTFVYELHSEFAPQSSYIYVDGFTGFLNIEFGEQESHTLVGPFETKHSFQTEEELSHVLDLVFSEIHKKQRLRNLYTPPKFHFENYLFDKNVVSSDVKEIIHHTLTQYVTPSRIEETILKKPPFRTISIYRNKIQAFLFENVKIVINPYEKKVASFQNEVDFKNELHKNVLSMTHRYFSPSFDTTRAFITTLMTRLQQLQNGVNIGEEWDRSTIKSICSKNIRLFQYIDQLVVQFEEEARSFSFNQMDEAFFFFSEKVADALLREYEENPLPPFEVLA